MGGTRSRPMTMDNSIAFVASPLVARWQGAAGDVSMVGQTLAAGQFLDDYSFPDEFFAVSSMICPPDENTLTHLKLSFLFGGKEVALRRVDGRLLVMFEGTPDEVAAWMDDLTDEQHIQVGWIDRPREWKAVKAEFTPVKNSFGR